MTSKTKTGAQPYEQAAEMYGTMIEQAIQLNRVIANGIERSFQEHMDLMEAAVEAMRPLTTVKQPADLVSTQMDVMKGLNQRAVATATNLLKIQQETGTEFKDAMLAGMNSMKAA